MWGRDTFATEVSSTSMKVASMTEMAMTQGFALGCHSGAVGPAAAASPAAPGGPATSVGPGGSAAPPPDPPSGPAARLVHTLSVPGHGCARTEGTTDMPGPSGWLGSGGSSKTILTGTRWTTLT